MNFTLILEGIAVLGAMGAIFGALLAFAAKIFHVEVDPTQEAVQRTCLAQMIVWRHGMDALDDRDVVFPVRYADATLRLLACLAAVSDCTDAQLVVLVTREVENDPEALSRLRAGLQIEIKMNAQEARDDEKM